MELVPIWKHTFVMFAMAMYLHTPLIFVVPEGFVIVGERKSE